ncbi:MAG: hypothetical protein HYV35_12470, partial [Lentisphaerae bacterium]|nr:hypothetical protein [Lentisphaerota bacterium]
MNHIRVAFFIGIVLSALLVWVGAGSDNIGIEFNDSDGDRMATDSNGGQDYQEVLSAGDANNYVYIDWLLPKTTNEFSCAWFLGAYRFNDGSLAVDLDRTILQTQNLAYALSYSDGRAGASRSAALVLNLLTTNGTVLVESGDLLSSSNVAHYVFTSSDAG